VSKYYVYLTGEAEEAFLAFRDEEGRSSSDTAKFLILSGLGITEPREKAKELPD